MRKLLLNSTAIATVAALTASAAVADVSISATSEFKYKSRSSAIVALDGTSYSPVSEIVFKFANKTDSGLTVGYVAEMASDGGTPVMDESSISIAGGFGKVILGNNDGAGEYGIAAVDLIQEESSSNVVSSTINTNSDIQMGNSDGTKISYHIPAMGGLTAGISHADSGADTDADTTTMGALYTMDMGGNTISVGGATTETEAATTNTESTNIGVKVVSGNLSLIVSSGTEDAVDEANVAQGMSATYKLANGVTLGAYSLKVEDDLDTGEKYTASGVEAAYTIAAGLTAVLTIDDYEYTKQTAVAESLGGTVNDSGTTTSLTIKAAF